ncbi:MAG: hypothetical protein KAY24_06250, partial [Candidatus Eisenbacteria sp.]|nr:hypothetical protein [Candidatus Eisenbacteria bacterium]
MLTWRELAAGSLAVGQLVEYVAAAGSSAARQVPRAPMIAGAVVGLVLFSAIVSTPVWPAEITLQGSLHGRGRMQLPGTVTDLQEGDARTDIRHDASLDLRGSGLRIRLRTRDSTWAGCGLLRTPGGGSILVGHLDLQWAAGCLFVSCEGSDLSRDIRSARNETLPLRARGTTAWRQDPQSGVVLQQRFRSLHLGTWRLERNLGFALALGPWAGAVDRAYTFQGNRWNWSSVLAWPPVPVVPGVVESVDPRAAGKATATGMTPSNRVLLELSGRFARSSSSGVVDRLGGHWRIGLTPVLGALSGAFRYGGLDHR